MRNKELALPTYNREMLEKFLNTIGLTGCKWSNLNAPGTETLLSHPELILAIIYCIDFFAACRARKQIRRADEYAY